MILYNYNLKEVSVHTYWLGKHFTGFASSEESLAQVLHRQATPPALNSTTHDSFNQRCNMVLDVWDMWVADARLLAFSFSAISCLDLKPS